MDIKETLDVLNAVDAEADALLAACADGRLTLKDLKEELPVVPKIREAFKNAMAIKDELADLDGAEVDELFDKIVSVASKTAEALAAVTSIVSAG